MLHKFFEEGYWFAPKRIGYGSGLPIAWQGWALIGLFILLAVGCGLLAEWEPEYGPWIAGAVMIPATIGFLLVARARTRGGWRWHSGDRD
ncbi:hypothetical protein [Altererythrobacter aquiaggeris]|uniref:hypothetical protein n=1 Tax=Aestuarierythrobacter aquiaggeris TaxID=1898396 RepID=UPI003018CB7E